MGIHLDITKEAWSALKTAKLTYKSYVKKHKTKAKTYFSDVIVYLASNTPPPSELLHNKIAECDRLRNAIKENRELTEKKLKHQRSVIQNYINNISIGGQNVIVDLDNIRGLEEFCPDPDVKVIRKVVNG